MVDVFKLVLCIGSYWALVHLLMHMSFHVITLGTSNCYLDTSPIITNINFWRSIYMTVDKTLSLIKFICAVLKGACVVLDGRPPKYLIDRIDLCCSKRSMCSFRWPTPPPPTNLPLTYEFWTNCQTSVIILLYFKLHFHIELCCTVTMPWYWNNFLGN